MFKLKLIFLILSIFLLGYSNVKAFSVVSFNNFVNDIRLVEKSNKNISILKAIGSFNAINNNDCLVVDGQDYLDVSPVCLLDKNIDLIDIPIKDSIGFLLDWLKWFWSYYSLSDEFTYYPTKPYFSYWVLNEYNDFKWSIYEQIVITYLEQKWLKIRIDKSTVSKLLFDDYSFYVVPTELSNRSDCSLANYRAAIDHLDELVLDVWQELNLNDLISYDSRACKWTTSKKYLFYAWACGSSTQLFRLSLLMPNLDVVERYPHSKRWAYYYWDKLSWDDAAMYEKSKQFIIRNNFDKEIYFRVYEQWTKSYLVGVVDDNISNYVKIEKSNSWLSSVVSKNIYSKYNDLSQIFDFNSTYSSYHYGRS